MSRNIRPGTLRAYAFGVMTGSLICAAITYAAPSKADVSNATVDHFSAAVCKTLDDGYDTFDGIIGIGMAIAERGYSFTEAGEIIAASVISTCPEYVPLLKRFAAAYGPNAASKVA